MLDVLPREFRMPALDGAVTWFNSPPLTAEDLRGKVVLVDFWTYTCINWLRTLPYVRAWAEKYADYGVVVVGVHTPEYDFEGELDNVRRAIGELDVGYPVAVDSGYTIWNAFANHYWPALYIVDQTGRVRHHQFGEGGYAEAERVIQRLLEDGGVTGFETAPVDVRGRGLEAPADWGNLRSPETYLGDDRGERFSSPGGAYRGISRSYDAPARLRLNHWSLSGTWTVENDSVVGEEPGAGSPTRSRPAMCT
ncbi:hypothetical protein GCM10025866_05720 [Naasia aerilata]|uniref:Thioredoxin domain-containing protein n=1 Tax=Naasia aerilata TaxID=1162966 RepID=A0ABM8G8Z5_9MICO|nr:hypothetical protein GCM10025866_05720 [Naasia aerilata]